MDDQDIKIEQYNQNVHEYRFKHEEINTLNKKLDLLNSILGVLGFTIYIVCLIVFGQRFSDITKDIHGIFLVSFIYAYLLISAYLIFNDFNANLVSFGNKYKLEAKISEVKEQEDFIYEKLRIFESEVCHYFQDKLRQFYENRLYKRRSGNVQFEESLAEFSMMIDQAKKVNSSLITNRVNIGTYEDYLLKRTVDHGWVLRVKSEAVESAALLAEKITHPGNLYTVRKLPPEEKYRTVRKIENWDEINKKRVLTGKKGEEIAVAMEQDYFVSINRKDLADKVRHVSVKDGDGLGFDILSFFEDGREKYIEVKSTTTALNTPYYISSNELEFIKAHIGSSYIYRFLVSIDIPQVKHIQVKTC